MKVILCQTDTLWLETAKNLRTIEAAIGSIDQSDLIVLPEMFNTAYIMDPSTGAEQLDGVTIHAMQAWAAKLNTVISGSMPLLIGQKYYNAFVFVDQNGVIDYYLKVHLFAPAGEDKAYTSGTREVEITINDVVIKPQICYDLRFPYNAFNKNKRPYDVLIYTANWPIGRIGQWEKLLIARAIENQCYVIGVNRVGSDENGFDYPGNSMVVDYKGDVVLEMDDRLQALSCNLDLHTMYAYRKKFPFLEDARM